MIKKKLAKMLTTCLMSVFIIGTASMTVHAESVRETEPNNTMETAETIMANHETAAQAVSGSRPSQHVVTGSTSNTDEDCLRYICQPERSMLLVTMILLNLRFMIQTAVLF